MVIPGTSGRLEESGGMLSARCAGCARTFYAFGVSSAKVAEDPAYPAQTPNKYLKWGG